MPSQVVRLDDFDHAGMREVLTNNNCECIRFAHASFRGIAYNVIQTRDPLHVNGAEPDWRWHVSVAGPEAVPPWDALVAIVHEVRPGVPFVVGIPPASWWMNVHPNVLHANETKDPNLIAQWRAERAGHEPT
jgi:hypothetical protein